MGDPGGRAGWLKRCFMEHMACKLWFRGSVGLNISLERQEEGKFQAEAHKGNNKGKKHWSVKTIVVFLLIYIGVAWLLHRGLLEDKNKYVGRNQIGKNHLTMLNYLYGALSENWRVLYRKWFWAASILEGRRDVKTYVYRYFLRGDRLMVKPHTKTRNKTRGTIEENVQKLF